MKKFTYQEAIMLANEIISIRAVYTDIKELLDDYEFHVDEKTEPDCLHNYIFDYNWDDGFALPYLIVCHPNCELATAVSAFWLADGTGYFEDQDEFLSVEESSWEKEWVDFVHFIAERVLAGCYQLKQLPFPEQWKLSKSGLYIHEKYGSDIPDIFFGIGL